MVAEPGPDERRIRHLLRQHGVGPDAHGDTMAADDWWEQLYDDEDTDPEPKRDEPAHRFQPQPDYYPRPRMPEVLTHSGERAAAALSPRTRRFLYNASAAGTGWLLGLYQQLAHAITDCGKTTSIAGALVLGIGMCLLIAHLWDRRTRHWWPGIAWAARIPLATALVALALYAPAASGTGLTP
jgi:hypothetical protein